MAKIEEWLYDSKALASQPSHLSWTQKVQRRWGHIPQACHDPAELRATGTGRDVFAFTVELLFL